MFKIRVPYSAVIGLIVGLVGTVIIGTLAAIAVIIGSLAAIAVEVAIAVIIYRSLSTTDEYYYDSFVGQLLLQYTTTGEVGLWNMLHLILGRIASYVMCMFMFSPPTFWLIIPSLLFLGTIVHYLPNK